MAETLDRQIPRPNITGSSISPNDINNPKSEDNQSVAVPPSLLKG